MSEETASKRDRAEIFLPDGVGASHRVVMVVLRSRVAGDDDDDSTNRKGVLLVCQSQGQMDEEI